MADYPFVTLTLRRTMAPHVWAQLLRRFYSELRVRDGKFGIVMHVFDGVDFNAQMRKVSSEIVKENEQLLAVRCVAWGQVLHSVLHRGIFTALTWLAPPTYPISVFSTPIEAQSWVENQLRQGRVLF
jgi:hypothetical protein